MYGATTDTGAEPEASHAAVARNYDQDGDGKLSREEYAALRHGQQAHSLTNLRPQCHTVCSRLWALAVVWTHTMAYADLSLHLLILPISPLRRNWLYRLALNTVNLLVLHLTARALIHRPAPRCLPLAVNCSLVVPLLPSALGLLPLAVD